MTARDLQLRSFDLALFTYHKETKCLVAEVSGLAARGMWLQRLYNDACDLGIAIHSPTTGRTVRFYLERTEEKDGDLLSRRFKPLDNAGPVTSVVVFND